MESWRLESRSRPEARSHRFRFCNRRVLSRANPGAVLRIPPQGQGHAETGGSKRVRGGQQPVAHVYGVAAARSHHTIALLPRKRKALVRAASSLARVGIARVGIANVRVANLSVAASVSVASGRVRERPRAPSAVPSPSDRAHVLSQGLRLACVVARGPALRRRPARCPALEHRRADGRRRARRRRDRAPLREHHRAGCGFRRQADRCLSGGLPAGLQTGRLSTHGGE